MKLPRWNNARLQRPQGKRAVLRALHSGQGLEVKKRFSLPVEGEVFSLTFPFIDQAIALRTGRELAMGLRPTHGDESALLTPVDYKRVMRDFRRSVNVVCNSYPLPSGALPGRTCGQE